MHRLVESAVEYGHTSIVLIQNGLNIEKDFVNMFLDESIISGVSLIAATETQPGHVTHDSPDILIVGEFKNPWSDDSRDKDILAAKKFVELYQASGNVECFYNQDIGFVR